ncbi:MAG: C4-dicarboxylate ABC transporter permease [Proteobacteria bacterium]|nr:MAG: C4-dicarboxylate ABC transporter permease [Pseudomonadota bacterium]
MLKLEKIFDKFAKFIGYICAFATFLMMLNVFLDVILRYFFKTGSLALQEMEWHFFSVVMLFGLVYTLSQDAHVRVDIVYDKLDHKKKAIINIFGTLIFLLPISLLIAINSTPYALESFNSNEGSADPGGLAYWWIVKGMIPLSFWFLVFYSVGFIIKNINLYRGCDSNLNQRIDKKALA